MVYAVEVWTTISIEKPQYSCYMQPFSCNYVSPNVTHGHDWKNHCKVRHKLKRNQNDT